MLVNEMKGRLLLLKVLSLL